MALRADVALGRGLSIDLNGGGDFASTAHTYTGSAAIAYTW